MVTTTTAINYMLSSASASYRQTQRLLAQLKEILCARPEVTLQKYTTTAEEGSCPHMNLARNSFIIVIDLGHSELKFCLPDLPEAGGSQARREYSWWLLKTRHCQMPTAASTAQTACPICIIGSSLGKSGHSPGP